jgi:hypothetical protein
MTKDNQAARDEEQITPQQSIGAYGWSEKCGMLPCIQWRRDAAITRT